MMQMRMLLTKKTLVHSPVCYFKTKWSVGHPSSLILAKSVLQVAFAPWNACDRLPGAGIVLYPTPNSSNLLFGAVLLSPPVPDFVAASFGTLIPQEQLAYSQQLYTQHMVADSSSYAMTYHTPLASPHSSRASQSPPGMHRSTHLWGTSSSMSLPSTPGGMSPIFTMTDPDDDNRVGRVSRTLGVLRDG
jgi:hypothetical protein